MLFVPSVWEDIHKYYRGTYVKFKNFGDTLFYIANVTSTQITGTDQDNNPFVLDLNEEAPFEMDYVLPHRAVFQYGDNAVVLHRRPERQYRRGLCTNNVQVLRVGSTSRMELTFDLLKAYVAKQQYYRLTDISNTTKASLALGQRLSVLVGTGDILLDNTIIGRYLAQKKAIRVRHSNFRKELEEMAKEYGLGIVK